MNDIVHFLNNIRVKGVDKPTDQRDKYGSILLQRLHNMTRDEVERALENVKQAVSKNEPLNVKRLFNFVKCTKIPGALFLANCAAQLLQMTLLLS